MKPSMVLDVHEKPEKTAKWLALSLQHLFAMFGATILVPLLTGLEPAMALLTSGIGTIAYLWVTRGQIPAYLGSSFAFIVPIITVSQTQGTGAAMFGCLLAGIIYGVVALIISRFGAGWLHFLLPPVVIGSVVIVIGLSLAGTAIDMASTEQVVKEAPKTVQEYQDLPGTVENLDQEAGTVTLKVYSLKHFGVALVTLAIAIAATLLFRGFLRLIPVLLGVVGGYTVAYFTGLVDLTAVKETPWLSVPAFTTPEVSASAALMMIPVALVTMAEHIGHLMVTGEMMDRDLAKNPGLHRSVLGDGVATGIAAMLGGPPNTTYGENIGVMAITRIYSVYVIAGAAALAISFSFIGKLSALISTIPQAVMGGASILLFGIIASAGLRMLVDNGIDFSDKRNLVIASVVLVIGVGGAALKFAGIHFELEGMALATLAGILLNLILPKNSAAGEQDTTFREAA
ncbi:solute carrier family 23 protein [Paludifilum halophilum]|uniref:Uracil permease n=1 Tax=Paludifilum halophilum TaxID=1642702 RepID=A0A235B322_9BACL|nr:solute carrier family 23 protein [Paludifilum halophilum]OYD06641.1 uracil permease [Paludifilum halophilum]